MSLIQNERWLENMADEYQMALEEGDFGKADTIIDTIWDYSPTYAKELQEVFDPMCAYDQLDTTAN